MIKHIILDWDDVIVLGAKEGYFAAFQAAIEDVGVHIAPHKLQETILSVWGASSRVGIGLLLKDNPELVDRALESYNEHRLGETFVRQLAVLPGVQDILRSLAKNYHLSVGSGSRPSMIYKAMEMCDIPNVFEVIITSYDLEDPSKHKPHPHMLELILEKTNTEASESVYVGDAENDIQMAINAGVTPVAVMTGHMDERSARKAGAGYIIKSLNEINEVVQHF